MKFYKKKKRLKKADVTDDLLIEEVSKVQETYKFVERREATIKNVDDLKQLGGIYSAQMLNYSRKSDPLPSCDESDDENHRRRSRLLKLPPDGSIFNDGIPFHHFALTQLKEKHILRLKKNGIEIKDKNFSSVENNQLTENWRSFAAAHNLPESDAPLYVSAATANETPEAHRERITFTRQTLLRPWLCSKLLNRTAIQVFRRCYHMFRISSAEIDDLRKWTADDDKLLLELVKEHGSSWEFIGNELMHPRYACYLRYVKLMKGGTPLHLEWSRVEIARLYKYLADHLPRNPVLIAVLPKYKERDSHIDWDDIAMNLPTRSAAERKAKWEELKKEFIAARERTQSDAIKPILREVLPEDATLLAKAKIPGRHRRKGKNAEAAEFLSPERMAKLILLLKEFLHEHQIEKIRNVDAESIKESFKSANESSPFHMRRFLRSVRYLMFIGKRVGLFKMLPLELDVLPVRFDLIAFILEKVEKFVVKKKVLRKYTRKFLRRNDWSMREQIVFVDQAADENKKYEDPIAKIVNILGVKKGALIVG